MLKRTPLLVGGFQRAFVGYSEALVQIPAARSSGPLAA